MRKVSQRTIFLLLVFAVIAVFGLGILGYEDTRLSTTSDPNSYEHIFNAIYVVLSMFTMEYTDTIDTHVDWKLTAARFIAAIILGYGIFVAIYKFVSQEWMVLKIKFFYRDHFVIFGLGKIGYQLGKELLTAGEQVVFLERDAENDRVQRVRQRGGKVIIGSAFDRYDIMKTGIRRAKFCAVLLGNDEANLKLSNFLLSLNTQENLFQNKVRVLAHVDNWYANNFINNYLDLYNQNTNFEFSPFNADLIGAQTIFDQYSPLNGVSYEVKKDEEGTIQIESSDNAIAIIGYNETTAVFLLENIILSHTPGGKRLTILLIEREAEKTLAKLRFKFPFLDDYLIIIPVELLDENFHHEEFRQPDFLSFLKILSGVYVFGEDDAYLMGLANSFKQLMYAELGELNNVPTVVCLPEHSAIISLLGSNTSSSPVVLDNFQNSFNINLFRLISETCTKEKLIDQIGETDTLAKTVNYFYSMLYDFEHEIPAEKKEAYQKLEKELEQDFLNSDFTTQAPLSELENTILGKICTTLGLSRNEWQGKLGIQARWQSLPGLKQLSNRYVARHLNVKIDFLSKIGYADCRKEDIIPFFHALAPVEHDRWTSEKLAYKFRFGPFPKDRTVKNLLKDTLKIH
ncbi:MAG: NAD(P)-binding protein, partial [Bacteroidota bacterium]